MSKKPKRLEADVVVVGSGPGGCTVAKEMSERGKKVILLEKGGWIKKFFGTMLVQARVIEKQGRTRAIEGDQVYMVAGVGGGTLVYVGAAYEPNHAMWQKYGIDITQEVQEARIECRVNQVPERLLTPGTKRLMTAALELGYPWELQDRFVDMEKCKYGCNKCVLGCPHGAKWTAVEFAEKAIKHGATLLTNVAVRDVIVEQGVAGGVRAKGKNGQLYEIKADVVVCSAGGMGTARILKRSGIYDAGNWFLGDPAVALSGFVKEGPSQKDDFQMAVGWRDEENGLVYENIYMPRSMFGAMALVGNRKFQGMKNLMFRYGKGMGIFCKIMDDNEGMIFLEDHKVSKPMTKSDRRRLEHGIAVSEQILIKAGCDPYNIMYSPAIHSHPGGTIRVGTLLDSNLETSIKNLYCCDTSVIPEGCGIPPVLTIVSLGKRLAKHLESVISGKMKTNKHQESVSVTA